MPFNVVKYKRGWRVVDYKGNYYSKKALTKKNARQQQKALYASEGRKQVLTGSGYSSYVDDEGIHHILLSGDGFFGDVWAKVKAVSNYVARTLVPVVKNPNISTISTAINESVRLDLPPKARATMAKYGNGVVYNINIVREPIQSFIDKALNFITQGRWTEAKKKYNYDKLFHLSCIASLSMPNGDKVNIKLEKNEVINITDDFAMKNPTAGVSSGSVANVSRHGSGVDAEVIPVPVPCCITLNELVNNAKEGAGNDFYKYDAFYNNCQRFITNLLKYSQLLTPEVEAFINQNAEGLLQELPSYTRPVANTITGIAGLANRIIEGEGEDALYGGCDGMMKCDCMEANYESDSEDEMEGGKLVFNQQRFNELQSYIPSKEKWEAGRERDRQRRPNIRQSNQTYEEWRKMVEDINRKRAMFDDEADARVEQAKEEAKRNNEEYARRVAENPDLEDVMCNYDLQGNRVKTRLTKGECRQANAVGFAEWEKKENPANYYFFRPAVNALANTTSFLSDVVPGVPDTVRKIGKSFADQALQNNSYMPTERGSGMVSVLPAFKKQLKAEGFKPEDYLRVVREIADEEGYDGRAIEFSDDPEKKLMIYDDEGNKVHFGSVNNGDYILWSKQEALGKVRKGYAEMKQRVFNASHSKIRGDWKSNKFSPNNLAMKILW
jgi:hypothetical protein